MKTVVLCQARMGSTRFPGKVLKPLGYKPLMAWTVHAAMQASKVDQVVVATSSLPQDDAIAAWCLDHAIPFFRGSEDDVLERCYEAALRYEADIVVRLTCDCPFIDPAVLTEVIRLREMTGADYCSNIDPPSYPDGLDVEVMTIQAIEAAYNEATTKTDRDCWPQFISRNRTRFKAANLRCPLPGMQKERWVCDTEADYAFCTEVAKRLPIGRRPHYLDILAVLDANPDLRPINSTGIRNERFYEGLARDRLPARTFKQSERIFDRAHRTIPFGAQTFSKSHIQFPQGRAPLYCSHADGAYIFDADGNNYVDLVNAVLPVVLGYRDADVDEAVRRQLDRGISFSLATELEADLSELLCRHIPCAEMVKFGKSGTDVTTAAVRLARAVTGRDHVLMSGYHGWADWSMAKTDRNLGIPFITTTMTQRLPYGDVKKTKELLHLLRGGVAGIIVEPNDNPEYLAWLRGECTDRGIILIFDEVITGFRYALGGAQALWNVTPDLACFGKAMANGMPISALVGRKDLMRRMEPPNNIFYSGTMFGETLSIAAAIATISKIERDNVIEHLWKSGHHLAHNINAEVDRTDLRDCIALRGESPRKYLEFSGEHKDAVRTLFMTEMIQNGVLIINSNNISFAHRGPELERIASAYSNTFETIAGAIKSGDIRTLAGATVSAAPLRQTA